MLINRFDCCKERLNHYIITVGNNDDGDNEVCVGDGGDVSDRLVINNRCEPPLEGRYVHVKLARNDLTLALCEVEVYDTYDGKY